jgi:hypothetical protein
MESGLRDEVEVDEGREDLSRLSANRMSYSDSDSESTEELVEGVEVKIGRTAQLKFLSRCRLSVGMMGTSPILLASPSTSC